MKIQEILNYISRTLETISRVSVQSLKKNVYTVSVRNFPRVQDIKGTVVVGNQKKVESEIKAVKKAVEQVGKTVSSQKYPEKVVVTNLKDFPTSISVNNFPKPTELKPYPTEMKVGGSVVVENLQAENDKIVKALKGIKLDPKIEVKSPQITVQPTPISFPDFPEQEKFVSSDPTQYVPVRLSDGEEFYNAVSNIVGGLKRPQTIANIDPLGVYQVSDLDEGATSYYGFVDKDEQWYIMQKTSTQVRYIAGSGEYAANWTDRAVLTYKYFFEVF